MTSVSSEPFDFDDPRVEALDRLLEQRAVAHGGMGLEQLDGFLSALVVGPEPVSASEWQPRVWGKTAPRWETPEEAGDAEALLTAMWNTVQKRVLHSGDDIPDALMPLWWLPEDPEAEHGDDVDIGGAWGAGYLHGVDLRGPAWDAWIEKDEWIAEIEAHAEALAVGSYPSDTEGGSPEPISYRERLEIFASLPDMLHDLHCHRIGQLTPREPVRRDDGPGRNDPCPCGSGQKFKKCHGAPARLN